MTRLSQHQPGWFISLFLGAIITLLLATTTADAAPELNTYVISSHFGWKVNRTTGENICTIASTNECVHGEQSSESGGFIYPESVAVAKNGNVYVADKVNHRIQEFGPSGEFILMFGWNVNKTKIEADATQAERNICTAASNNVCQAGEAWSEERQGMSIHTGLPEQLDVTQDVAVDQETGNIYVLDGAYNRIDEYTENGEFVLMIGGQVNKTKVEAHAPEEEQNLCTTASHDTCQPGTESSPESTAHGAFKTESDRGNLLALGPGNILYVGDEGRIQKFDSTGKWMGEISLAALSKTGKSSAITVDTSGTVYVAESEGAGVAGVRQYNEAGVLQSTVIDPGSTTIVALGWDPHGRLGVIELEEPVKNSNYIFHGMLYTPTGEMISKFDPLSGAMENSDPRGLAFTATGALYVALEAGQEIEVYKLGLYPDVRTCPAREIGATSATLCGEINPNGLSTIGFFSYRPPLGSKTLTVFEGNGEVFAPADSVIAGLVPNETYTFTVGAQAEFEGKTETVISEPSQLHTSLLAPIVLDQVQASFVTYQSAVLSGTVNPEHDSTEYYFQYGACPTLTKCEGIKTTSVETADQYGNSGVVQETGGLIPRTRYVYRLIAINEAGETTSKEGTFETSELPPVTAITGAANVVTTTSAVVTGMVYSSRQAATCTFELGVYNGAITRYGTVLSTAIPPGSGPTEESLQLTGLQAGTTYAYRIAVASGYGQATGATLTFVTQGLPSVLSSPIAPPILSIPRVAFPVTSQPPKPKPKPKGKTHKTKAKKTRKAKKTGRRATRTTRADKQRRRG